MGHHSGRGRGQPDPAAGLLEGAAAGGQPPGRRRRAAARGQRVPRRAHAARRRDAALLRDLAGQVRHPGVLRRPASAAGATSPTSCSRGRRVCATRSSARCRCVHDGEEVAIGLPDTIWFPEDGLRRLPERRAVVPAVPGRAAASCSTRWSPTRRASCARSRSSSQDPGSNWVWGAFKMPGGRVSRAARALARARARRRVLRHAGERLARARRPGDGRARRRGLRGRRHAERLPRGDQPAEWRRGRSARRAAATGARADAHRTARATRPAAVRSAGWRSRPRVRALGPWFHNMELAGVRTAPDTSSATTRRVKWRRFANAIPRDLRGRTVLDIGCNAGFYAIEMKRRGADAGGGHRLRRGATWRRPASPPRWRASRSSSGSCRSTTWRAAASASTSCSSWACSTTCGIRCSRSTCCTSTWRATCSSSSRMQRGSTRCEPLAGDYPFGETAIFDDPAYPEAALRRAAVSPPTRPTGGSRTAPASRRMLRSAGLRDPRTPGGGGLRLPAAVDASPADERATVPLPEREEPR